MTNAKSKMHRSLMGALHIGVTHSFNEYLFPATLAAFVERYPGVRVKVTAATTQKIEKALLKAQLDIGVVLQTSERREFNAKELFKSDIVALVSRNHSLAQSRTIRYQDLKTLPLVLQSDGATIRQIIDSQFAKVDLHPNLLLETNELNILLTFVRSRRAVGLVSRQAVIHLNDLCKIPFQEHRLIQTANLVWPFETKLSRLTKAFVQIASQILTSNDPNFGLGLHGFVPIVNNTISLQ